jgi:hypothetical protein
MILPISDLSPLVARITGMRHWCYFSSQASNASLAFRASSKPEYLPKASPPNAVTSDAGN